ncbi:MAG TPA: hypothetical protein VHU84_18145 [Lacipirellulaceae bacterium]|jgi:hypothetical protein|nr:hypothetical protein [Lacipirellulaceae bacterium]
MPNDTPSADTDVAVPRKKRSIYRWLIGAFVVLLLLFCFQLFGPNPRIIVSPQTTYITDPLRADGLPDYEKYVLNLYRNGVTPENNAAALLWPAIGPSDLGPAENALVCAELGLGGIPQESEALAPIDTHIKRTIAQWSSHPQAASPSMPAQEENNQESDDFGPPSMEQLVDRYTDRLNSRPWTTAEFPLIAEWAQDNQAPFDQIVAASHRPRCYFPSAALLGSQDGTLPSISFPGQESTRNACRALIIRALWHVGEHRNADAWRDLLAIHRLGRLIAQGPFLIEQLIGFSVIGIASTGTLQLLHEGNLTPDEARGVLHDLESLPPLLGVVNSTNNAERVSLLETCIQLSQHQIVSNRNDDFDLGDSFSHLLQLNIDWNIVLRKATDDFDRCVAAVRLPTYSARHQALRQFFDGQANDSANRFTMRPIVASVFNPRARSETVADIIVACLMPNVDMGVTADVGTKTRLELLHIATALTIYRADHGSYPESPEALVPNILPTLPVDLYNTKPFAYKRIDGGYLLYSLGPNGINDGGSSENEGDDGMQGVRLEELTRDELERLNPQIPTGADDIAIRVPLPPIKLPKLASQPAHP